MMWLLPDVMRGFMPSCPPAVVLVRVVTFVVVAVAAMVLLGRGLSPHEVLVVLGAIGAVTVMLTRPTGTGSRFASLIRAVSLVLAGGVRPS